MKHRARRRSSAWRRRSCSAWSCGARSPIAPQASRKIWRMSLEVFVKRYRGYAVPIAPDPVDDPTPVRMDQTPEKLAGIGFDDRDLPVGQNDRALVLHARPVLRKETGPVVPVGRRWLRIRHNGRVPTLARSPSRTRAMEELGQVDRVRDTAASWYDAKPVGRWAPWRCNHRRGRGRGGTNTPVRRGVAIAAWKQLGGSVRASSPRRASTCLHSRIVRAIDPSRSRDLTVVPALGNEREHSLYLVS